MFLEKGLNKIMKNQATLNLTTYICLIIQTCDPHCKI